MRTLRRGLISLFTVGSICGSALFATSALAQAYPSRPIRIIVPYAAGGLSDISARMLGKEIAAAWGQPVVVENKPGANAMIGTDMVAKSPPDGYTLLLATNAHVINPYLYKSLPFDSVKDIAPVSMMAIAPLVVLVHPSVKAKSFAELVALAKTQPVTHATSGTGSPAHLTGELLNMRAGTRFQHIPYKGAGPALSDVVAGHVAVMFNALPASVPYIKSGQLNAFAVGTPKRSPLMPELPTVAELGYPGFNASTFVSIMAPGRTPPDIINKLATEIQRALATPAFAEWVRSQGMDSVGSTPQQFAADLAAEASQWQQVVKQTGIQAE